MPSGRSSRPKTPPASAARCRRRVAVRSSPCPAPAISTAPPKAGQRRASSMAQSASGQRAARARIRRSGARPKGINPGGQTRFDSCSVAIQSTWPPQRASNMAAKATPDPGLAAQTSCNAPRARPAPIKPRSAKTGMGAAAPAPGARVVSPARVSRSRARAALRAEEGLAAIMGKKAYQRNKIRTSHISRRLRPFLGQKQPNPQYKPPCPLFPTRPGFPIVAPAMERRPRWPNPSIRPISKP